MKCDNCGAETTASRQQVTLTGQIIPSSGPIPGGYYMAIRLDKQEPWPAGFHNGQQVRVTAEEGKAP